MASFTIKPGDADTSLREDNPTLSYGSADPIYLGWLTKDDEMRLILRVDFTADIPAGATIDTAALYMAVGSVTESVTGLYWGYRIKTPDRDWVESEATWNIYKTGSSWAAPGCRGTADYDTSIKFGSWTVTGGGWKSVDVKTFLQDAVDNRSRIFDAVLNNEVILGSGDNSYHTIHTKEYGDSTYHWYIEGTYTAAAGGAEPWEHMAAQVF